LVSLVSGANLQSFAMHPAGIVCVALGSQAAAGIE
jgi:hypothetical protein